MTIRFAAAPQAGSSPIARVLGWSGPQAAANDNPGRHDPLGNRAVREALEHFAVYGLNAASEARRRALAARAEGDAPRFKHWLAICRVLDGRMAGDLAPPEAC